ncbi:unnamed protein product [Moneuplotes crassus]|uniref:EamA domain-containing protein n=1 Tax=Euplotes crassus TaxID=5936 RepID=A0AAD1XF46_EUPCR|nr:unnamed protein product [Moneuplotes crassus]
MVENIPRYQVYLLMLGMTFAGSASTITQKLQNSQMYFNDQEQQRVKYQHPFFQTFVMLVGELVCLPLFYLMRCNEIRRYGEKESIPSYISAQERGLNMKPSKLWLIIPAIFDLLGSTLLFISLTMISASVYQMLKGALVFIATIYSIIFLKRRYHRHHWTALFIVITGVIIVGASPIIYPEEDSQTEEIGAGTIIFGIILEVVALLFIGGNWISEEILFQFYYLHPIEVVGWEGFWGALMYCFILIGFQFIPCHNTKICRYGVMEDTIHAFYEFGQNNLLWMFAILLIVWTALFNIFNVAVTKYASAAQRSTVDTCRTALIWAFFIFYTGEGHERFIWLELVGFTLLIIGTLIHTEVIIFPFFGFNKNTQKSKEDMTKQKHNVNESDRDKILSEDTYRS